MRGKAVQEGAIPFGAALVHIHCVLWAQDKGTTGAVEEPGRVSKCYGLNCVPQSPPQP